MRECRERVELGVFSGTPMAKSRAKLVKRSSTRPRCPQDNTYKILSAKGL